ncbi:hypothetical protein DICVIV_06360 [Dictyocaulus viviparus]|uniref:Major facilitator superfamily (MFS) profile domain-containing protein n=1 Tax=Dictyocaulus viviparus TaxID=29172 RepID=A0A0D8XUX1_DICVI|nr:hypothetical protein DICVIV_06360 [Dictyocaulus viviparus]
MRDLEISGMRLSSSVSTEWNVVISEPGSPDVEEKMYGSYNHDQEAESPRVYFDDDESGSLEGMNRDFDYSSLSINLQSGADVTAQLIPVPPDGGYGWIIVLAAFFSNLIVDGVCTSFTEFKNSYSQYFHASDAATALIGSLLIGVYLLVEKLIDFSLGPVVGGLVNKYGARKVVVTGGIGFGMIYLPAIVAVGYYFESKRAIATGIAVAGSGVGTMIMPFITDYCITSQSNHFYFGNRVGSSNIQDDIFPEFGWKYTVWILAVIVFLCALFGILYRPLKAPSILQKDQELIPLRAALRKMSEADEENRAISQMSSDQDSPVKRYSRIEAENVHDDPVMARLRNALSECENDNDTSPSTPVRQPLSPVLENAMSKNRAGSAYQAPTTTSTRSRKQTLTSGMASQGYYSYIKA